jgi:hypothetical protein
VFKFLRRNAQCSRAPDEKKSAPGNGINGNAKPASRLTRTDRGPRHSGPSIPVFGSGGLKLNHSDRKNSPRAVASRGGGSMLYGINSALNQMQILDINVLDTLNSSLAGSDAPAPERPSSTR